MSNTFIDHKDRWLSLAESESDYAMLFIRNWIPFNAWYCCSHPDLNNSDRRILDEMKTSNNIFTTRIVDLLRGSDSESIQFKNLLGELYRKLESHSVPSVDDRISFNNIYFRLNPTTSAIKTVRRHTLKVELIRNGNQIQIDAVVTDSINQTKFSYRENKYRKPEFVAEVQASTLTDEMKNILKGLFEEINPKRKESLVCTSKRGAKLCGGINFMSDERILAQGVIEVLYNIRCILFHGEIHPTKSNLTIYEPAYYMLRMLVKSLI